MTERATVWALTINNPTASDEEAIALARQKGWKVEGQLEQGTEGTPHYQLMLRTPQVRFAAVKKAFPRANISIARNVAALQTYVHKEETRVGELPITQEKYPSLSKMWELIYAYIYASDWCKYLDGPDDFRVSDKQILVVFDDAIENLIEDGYYVESLGVNPQVRSAWSKYAKAIFKRTHWALQSQTDRQTDSALESTVELPCSYDINGREGILREEEVNDQTEGDDSCSQDQVDGAGQDSGEATDQSHVGK